MSKQKEILKLERTLRDAESRRKTLLTNIEAHDKEIAILADQIIALEENITCLKKNRIVAIAKEFQKTKEELKKITTKLGDLTYNLEKFKQGYGDTQDLINDTEKELKKFSEFNDNVLQFKRKTDG